jgi:hypothetical protein
MKNLLRLGALAAILVAVLSTPAYAWHGSRGGVGYYGGHGAYGGGYYGGYRGYAGYGWGWGGVALGAAVTSLAFQSAYLANSSYYGSPYYAPYYVDPFYAAPLYVPQTYVEAQPIAAPVANKASWYYCKASKAYYPYVQTCKSGWQAVPTVPPDM